jgi:hypothetical protein
MDRKEITAKLMGFEAEELLGFKDYGEQGTAAIAPDGRKFTYSDDELKAAEQAAQPAKPAKPSSPRTTKPGGKAPAKRAARKPATRSRSKKAESKK